MPYIHWKHLPREVRKHLEDRSRIRELTADDLARLMEWILSNPEVPDEAWCKDFGAFKLVGHGAIPETFLEKGQPCFGSRI